jgi:methyltransferase (TIGR00027 family)
MELDIAADKIGRVSQTSLVMAYARYRERERDNPLVDDPYAGLFLSAKAKAWLSKFHWPAGATVRTWLIDRLLQAAMEKIQPDLVVNLGCGLDCRAYRLDLPPNLRWWDVDFPEVMDFRKKILESYSPACRWEGLAVDLRRAAVREQLVARIGCEAERAVVFSEGMLVYMTTGQAAALSRELAVCQSVRCWVSDVVSGFGCQLMAKRCEKYYGPLVKYRFAVDDPVTFFKDHGWPSISLHSLLAAGEEAGRSLEINWALYYYSERMKRLYDNMGGVVVLEK